MAKKFLDDFMLKMSSTKLGQTDYDKDKDYNAEEPPVSLKQIGYILLAMVVIVAIGAGIMFLHNHFSNIVVVGAVFVVAILATIVMMFLRR